MHPFCSILVRRSSCPLWFDSVSVSHSLPCPLPFSLYLSTLSITLSHPLPFLARSLFLISSPLSSFSLNLIYLLCHTVPPPLSHSASILISISLFLISSPSPSSPSPSSPSCWLSLPLLSPFLYLSMYFISYAMLPPPLFLAPLPPNYLPSVLSL